MSLHAIGAYDTETSIHAVYMYTRSFATKVIHWRRPIHTRQNIQVRIPGQSTCIFFLSSSLVQSFHPQLVHAVHQHGIAGALKGLVNHVREVRASQIFSHSFPTVALVPAPRLSLDQRMFRFAGETSIRKPENMYQRDPCT